MEHFPSTQVASTLQTLVQFDRVSGWKRFLVYMGIWVLAMVAFQVFLSPEGATTSAEPEWRQRISWPLLTPVFVLYGLSHVVRPEVYNSGSASA